MNSIRSHHSWDNPTVHTTVYQPGKERNEGRSRIRHVTGKERKKEASFCQSPWNNVFNIKQETILLKTKQERKKKQEKRKKSLLVLRSIS
jgi:hypothetical protein